MLQIWNDTLKPSIVKMCWNFAMNTYYTYAQKTQTNKVGNVFLKKKGH